MVLLYDESFSALSVPKTGHFLLKKTHSKRANRPIWAGSCTKITANFGPKSSREAIK